MKTPFLSVLILAIASLCAPTAASALSLDAYINMSDTDQNKYYEKAVNEKIGQTIKTNPQRALAMSQYFLNSDIGKVSQGFNDFSDLLVADVQDAKDGKLDLKKKQVEALINELADAALGPDPSASASNKNATKP